MGAGGGVETFRIEITASSAGVKKAAAGADAALAGVGKSAKKAGAEADAAAASGFGGFQKKLGSMGTAWAATGKKMASTGKTITTHVGLPLVAVGAYAVKSSLDFHKAMTLVQTQAGASAGEVKKLSESVLRFSASGQTDQGPKQLAEGLYAIESAGIRGSKAMSTLRASSNLAMIGQANFADTTKALVAAQKTGIAGSANLNKEIGTLNATVGAGQMHMNDLLAAMGTGFLSSAKAVGLNLTDVGGALAELTKQGIPASSAATRLRMAFTLMAAPTSKAISALQSIGIGQDTLAKTMRTQGLVPALELLQKHLDGLSKVKQVQVLSAAFGGARSGSAILALLGNLGDVSKSMVSIRQHSDEVNQSLAAAKATAAEHLKLAWAQLQTALVRLGDVLIPIVIPALQKLAEVITGLLTGFTKLPGPVKTAILVVAGLAIALGPLLIITGRVIQSIGILAGALGGSGALARAFGGASIAADEATTSMGLFSAALAPEVLVPAGAIALGVVAFKLRGLIGDSGDLYDSWKKVRGEFGKKLAMPALGHSDIIGTLDHLNSAIKRQKQAIGNLPNDYNGWRSAIGGVRDAQKALTKAIEQHGRFSPQSVKAANDLADAQKRLNEATKGYKTAAATAFDTSQHRIDAARQAIKEYGANIRGIVHDTVGKATPANIAWLNSMKPIPALVQNEKALAAAVHQEKAAENERAGAAIQFQRLMRGAKPLTAAAIQDVGKLAVSFRGLPAAKRLVLHADTSTAAQKLSIVALNLRHMTDRKTVANILIHSQNAEQAIARIQKKINEVAKHRYQARLDAIDHASKVANRAKQNILRSVPKKTRTVLEIIDHLTHPLQNAKRNALSVANARYRARLEMQDNLTSKFLSARDRINQFVSARHDAKITATTDQAQNAVGTISQMTDKLVAGSPYEIAIHTTYTQSGHPPHAKAAGGAAFYANVPSEQGGRGGAYSSPKMLVGDHAGAGPEYVISPDPSFRSQNEGYLAAAAGALGYALIPAYAKGGRHSRGGKHHKRHGKHVTTVTTPGPGKPSAVEDYDNAPNFNTDQVALAVAELTASPAGPPASAAGHYQQFASTSLGAKLFATPLPTGYVWTSDPDTADDLDAAWALYVDYLQAQKYWEQPRTDVFSTSVKKYTAGKKKGKKVKGSAQASTKTYVHQDLVASALGEQKSYLDYIAGLFSQVDTTTGEAATGVDQSVLVGLLEAKNIELAQRAYLAETQQPILANFLGSFGGGGVVDGDGWGILHDKEEVLTPDDPRHREQAGAMDHYFHFEGVEGVVVKHVKSELQTTARAVGKARRTPSAPGRRATMRQPGRAGR